MVWRVANKSHWLCGPSRYLEGKLGGSRRAPELIPVSSRAPGQLLNIQHQMSQHSQNRYFCKLSGASTPRRRPSRVAENSPNRYRGKFKLPAELFQACLNLCARRSHRKKHIVFISTRSLFCANAFFIFFVKNVSEQNDLWTISFTIVFRGMPRNGTNPSGNT